MDADLAAKLHRRFRRTESVETASDTSNEEIDVEHLRPAILRHSQQEFSRKQIQNLMETFDKFDTDKDKFLNYHELKYMMEKLGIPQTHLSLKELIRRVDEDCDGKVSFREFLSIFRTVLSENAESSPLFFQFYALLFEIDVAKEGVYGAKNFFEAKAAAIKDSDKFHREIRDEQEQRRREEEEKLRRKLAFQTRLAQFQI